MSFNGNVCKIYLNDEKVSTGIVVEENVTDDQIELIVESSDEQFIVQIPKKRSEKNEVNLNECCVFIPVSDVELFEDFDMYEGLSACLYLDNGIVVTKEDEKEYRKIVENFEKNREENEN